ncbi:MAG TPA: ATPase, T2SS/T4P/T4SS family, partial [Planctomycetaceae bacterium]|nr:ATPase, T2SS/T4P/T4SS family [Planctomycetaceae bacterium]
MIFGFGNKGGDDDDDDDEEVELVAFKGATNGKEVDMSVNARLAQAGLIPAKELVTDALQRRAETVKVELKGERAQITLYVDGIAYSGGKLAKPQAVAVTQMMKLLAGLEPKLKGKAQSGGVKADWLGVPYEISVDTQPAADGSDKLTLRTRNLKAKMGSLEELNFPASLKATLREISSKRHGLVIVAGPPGSGVTTSAYAYLKGLDLYMYSAFTIVNMGNREVYNVQKFEANEGDELQFTMERMIRSEADVIF